MRPLLTCQQVMTWLSMCAANESTSKTRRICYAIFTLIVCIIPIIGLLGSIAFFVEYVSVDFESSLYAVWQVAAELAMLNLIIVGSISRHRIAAIFTELAKIYTANEAEASYRFLVEANKKSEWLWQIYFKLGPLGLLSTVLVSIVASIIYCFHKYGAFDADHLYRPNKVLLPFNQHTPYGYFADASFAIVYGQMYILCTYSVAILFTSICWHHQAFSKIFHHTILTMELPENRRRANRILCKLIRFHITVRDWFLESAEVYSPMVLVQLVCNVIYVAAVFYELDLRVQRSHIDLEFFVLLFALPVGLCTIYLYCYFGQLATESYEKMAESLYESNWHEMSLDLKKKSLLMIMNMQTPVVYHGFGVAIMNLQTFIKVIRAVLTYYMMFKTLSE